MMIKRNIEQTIGVKQQEADIMLSRFKIAVIYMILGLSAFALIACVTEIRDEQSSALFSNDVWGYTYKFEGRDGDWERDIVYIARAFLDERTGHPLMGDRYSIHTCHDFLVGLPRTLIRTNFYDPLLREQFINRICELIQKIPYLSNFGITMRLTECIVLLNDMHSGVHGWGFAVEPKTTIFPLNVQWFYKDANRFIVTSVPIEHEHLLFSQLAAINCVPIEAIIGQAARFVATENDYAISRVLSVVLIADFLRYLGIMGDEEYAEITFVSLDGDYYSVILESAPSEDIQAMELVFFNMNSDEWLKHQRTSEFYWFEHFPDERLLYFRYRRCLEMYEFPFSQIVQDIVTLTMQYMGVEKFIIDFRGNSGGFFPQTFMELINHLNSRRIENVYILIDEGTASAAVSLASILRRACGRCDSCRLSGSASP